MSIPKSCDECHLNKICVIGKIKGFPDDKINDCSYLKWWSLGNKTEQGFDEFAINELEKLLDESE